MSAKKKIEALRKLMKQHGLSAYLVPSTDPHQSEYVPECWQRRKWLSGFTGSAGDVLVTQKEAGLWTDGRYWLQAEKELRGSGIRLFKAGESKIPKLQEYAARNLKEGEVLGVDPQVVSYERCQDLEKQLKSTGAQLGTMETNLVDLIWEDRPSIPEKPVRALPMKFTGESVSSKLRRLRKAMKEKRAEAHVFTTLDAIAWLCNIRGQDVEFNPVTISYAIVTQKEASLFVSPDKISPSVARTLGSKVTIRPYDDFASAVRELASSKAVVWVDGSTVSRWVTDLLKGCNLITERTPLACMKSKKNPTEISGMREAHIKDGVAMARFLRWLEGAVGNGDLTEISVADRLAAFRAEGELFQGLSFRTISGYGGNGAIIHYSATPESDVPMKRAGIYLVDSGGQYLDGTTDITRTVLLGGKATREQKDRFTRVLQGHIGLARAKFPEGVSGIRLDTLARLPLWDANLDYNHGTGHGVGAFLNVHEGPQSISPGRDTGAALEPGNILSNEPGYYKAGAYGFRTESLILVVEDGKSADGDKKFLRFETLTMCPIDTRLVDVKLLDVSERKWLNDYHKTVYRTLSPRLESKDRAWLKKACAPI